MPLEEQEICARNWEKEGHVNLALLTHAPISAIPLECQIIRAARDCPATFQNTLVEQKTRLQIVVMEVFFAREPLMA